MNRVRKFKISLLTILMTFGIGISGWVLYNASVFPKPHLEIPKTKRMKMAFQEINKVTKLAKLKKLREKRLAGNDVEIRMWRGGSLSPVEGMIFRKIDDKWTAFHIKSDHHAEPTKARGRQIYGLPRSGWESFTKQIFEAGILTLPDSESIKCQNYAILDGGGFVVEIYKDNVYRTYGYAEYSKPECIEGRKISEIARIIAREFYNGRDKCSEAEWLPCLSRERE